MQDDYDGKVIQAQLVTGQYPTREQIAGGRCKVKGVLFTS